MRQLLHPEFESNLNRLEYMLSQPGRNKSAVIGESNHMLRRLFNELMHSRYSTRVMGPEMNDSLHLLRRRMDRARTPEEFRNLVRDFRQYLFAASSFTQAQEMEERLHELESQMKTVAEGAASDIPMTGEDVITLESLKKKKVLFTVMPFHEDFQDVWTGGIQRAATGTGLTSIRIDMINKSSEVTDDIVSAIRIAEIVVVDVTRNNPNVMSELGLCPALKHADKLFPSSTAMLTDSNSINTSTHSVYHSSQVFNATTGVGTGCSTGFLG